MKMYPDSSHTMHTDSDSVYAKLYEEYSNTVIYNAEPPEHVLIYEGEYEEFSRINDSFYIYTGTEIILISVDKSQTEIRLIYSPAGNISNIHFTPNLIYIVEDGMLKVMLPDGSDIREITFVGETVEFKPITTTKSRFVKVYYGDYQLTQQDINTVFDYYYSMCEELISIGREDGIELFEDELEKMFYWEYYTLDIISLQIEKVNDTEYYKFR